MNCKFILTVLLVFVIIRSQCQDTLYLKKYAGNLKAFEVTIDRKTYRFLFDTGGGETFISPEIARTLNRRVYGNFSGFRMSGEKVSYQKCDSIRMSIGSVSFFSEVVGVWDIMGVLPKELPSLDGVISLRTFEKRQVTIDLANDKIIIETPNSFKKKIKTASPLLSRIATGIAGGEYTIFIGIQKDQKLFWFLFDSGNLDKFLFSLNTAVEWGLKKDTLKTREEFAEVQIPFADKTYTVAMASRDILYDGVINFEFLSEFIFHMDLSTGNVWVK